MKAPAKTTLTAVLLAAGIAFAAFHVSEQDGWAGLIPAAHATDLTKAKPAELFSHLRASKVYVNSNELPRFGYSNGVVVNSWTRPLKLEPVAGSEETAYDLAAHAQSAVDRLGEQLAAVGVSKEAVLTIYIYYDSTGDAFDDLLTITGVLNQFMAARQSYVTNPPALNDVPIRNVHGVRDVARHLGLKNARGARVAFQAVVLDPETTSSKRIFDVASKAVRSDGRAHFLIGGMVGQNMAFTVPTEEQPQTLLANLDKVLAEMGASRSDIEAVTLRYTHKSGLSASGLKDLVEQYFAESRATPRITVEEIDVAGFPANEACIEAEGAIDI